MLFDQDKYADVTCVRIWLIRNADSAFILCSIRAYFLSSNPYLYFNGVPTLHKPVRRYLSKRMMIILLRSNIDLKINRRHQMF